ncbi:uncharacterized protein BDZ99DRAFT_547554 [Mytilinidion resinicola]|uniref:Xylanolytic transcriptional activator regulatory domain-containing protein n=1 Tax=Mytilinidion resinicola TaxID=574789 RepID=A0A6A6Y307_9PEZI|nr:uncharacterized protein BDZ99DRAFT_547554 [Mytilinidion resinicola]KAF2803050.1 hypothetical protein BDZ99DRAFT_547554 [Mytilinidion resinicola]
MFYGGLRTGDARRYSAFLHVCILAIGLRYADKSDPGIQEFIGDASESVIHQKALWIARYEAEGRCDVPAIQALLLLGDLKFGVGRYNSGWMYAGLASRLCFDIGLHQERSESKLSEEVVHMHHMVV